MDGKHGFRAGRHVVFNLHAHLVFITKYRHGVITQRVRSELEQSFHKVCEDFESELLEFDGSDDHVHLLVAYPSKVALSRLVNSLKGVSARRIKTQDLPEIDGKLSGTAFWSPSYCAVSSGDAPPDIIKRYIQDQRQTP
jgi:putative transposase